MRSRARAPRGSINYENLIQRSPELRRRKLVLAITSHDMREMRAEAGQLSFIVFVPAEPGSRLTAPVRFELHSPKFVEEFQRGKKTYSCGPSNCDTLVVVATLAASTVDHIDKLGNVKRLPLFEVQKLADRYGIYRKGE
jgi:hypothetical protein